MASNTKKSKFYIQSNLGFRTSRSSNNSVFEQKIRDENESVLEQNSVLEQLEQKKRTTATRDCQDET